jgi:hypothetical protein
MDPIELHVEQATAAGVRDARIGDARELPWPDASVDAVLLLGPLYHLPERADRDRRDRSRVLSRKGTRRRASAPRRRQDRCRAGSAPLAATLPHHPLDHRAAPRPHRSSTAAPACRRVASLSRRCEHVLLKVAACSRRRAPQRELATLPIDGWQDAQVLIGARSGVALGPWACRVLRRTSTAAG